MDKPHGKMLHNTPDGSEDSFDHLSADSEIAEDHSERLDEPKEQADHMILDFDLDEEFSEMVMGLDDGKPQSLSASIKAPEKRVQFSDDVQYHDAQEGYFVDQSGGHWWANWQDGQKNGQEGQQGGQDDQEDEQDDFWQPKKPRRISDSFINTLDIMFHTAYDKWMDLDMNSAPEHELYALKQKIIYLCDILAEQHALNDPDEENYYLEVKEMMQESENEFEEKFVTTEDSPEKCQNQLTLADVLLQQYPLEQRDEIGDKAEKILLKLDQKLSGSTHAFLHTKVSSVQEDQDSPVGQSGGQAGGQDDGQGQAKPSCSTSDSERDERLRIVLQEAFYGQEKHRVGGQGVDLDIEQIKKNKRLSPIYIECLEKYYEEQFKICMDIDLGRDTKHDYDEVDQKLLTLARVLSQQHRLAVIDEFEGQGCNLEVCCAEKREKFFEELSQRVNAHIWENVEKVSGVKEDQGPLVDQSGGQDNGQGSGQQEAMPQASNVFVPTIYVPPPPNFDAESFVQGQAHQDPRD